MSLVSMNQLPRAWPLLSDWMHLSHWTDATEIKKAKQNDKNSPLGPPEDPASALSLFPLHGLLV